MMEQEYNLSIFSKIFYGLAVVAMFGIAGVLLFNLMGNGNAVKHNTNIVMSIVLLFGASILSSYIIRRRVNISKEEGITVRGMFDTKQLPSQNIKGFRVEEKTIFVETTDWNYKRLRINDYSGLERTEDLIKTLNEHYTDIDELERGNALAELLSDNEFGFTEEERNRKLEIAKKKALVFNIGGGVLFLGCFLRGYDFAVCLITFLYPLIGILLIVSSKGVIKFFTKENSPLPSVYIGMYVPSIVLMIVTITDYHIIDHSDIWLPFLLICLFLIAVISIKGITKTSGKAQFFILLFIALCYGYGSTLMINCGFDNSAAQTFTATVLDKYKAKDVPYVKISDWGNYKESGDIKVLNSFYNQVQSGSTVDVKLKKGLINIPWYYISQ